MVISLSYDSVLPKIFFPLPQLSRSTPRLPLLFSLKYMKIYANENQH